MSDHAPKGNLTNEQQKLALSEVRRAIYDRLKGFCFTDQMLKDKSIFQLLNLLELLSGGRNYLGMFSHTCIVLEEIFGADAFWNKPVVEPKAEEEKDQEPLEEQKPVVH